MSTSSTSRSRVVSTAPWRKRVGAAAAAVVVSAALAACTGGGSGNDASAAADGKSLDLVFVSHGPVSDPFWVVVNNGYEAAMKQLGDKGVYRGPQTATVDVRLQRQQLEQAIATKPDGLIVSNQDPAALNPTIQKAVDAGIPTVVVNLGGADEAKTVGALTYVGSDEKQSGVMAAERFKEEGVSKPVVVTAPPGLSPAVDERNDGFTSVYPDAVLVRIPAAQVGNATAVTKAIEASLARNEDADAVFSIGSLFNPSMLAARKSVGDRADGMTFGSIDLGDQVVAALKSGEMDFALDQQQWLQGYDPVLILDQYVRYGIAPGTSNVVTGPSFVTKDLLGAYAASIKAGVR